VAIPVVETYLSNHGGTSSSNTLTCNKPADVAVGDLLVLIGCTDASTDTIQFTDNKGGGGWIFAGESGNTTSDAHIGVFYKIADGNEDASESIVTVGTYYWDMFYIRISGINPNDIVEASTFDESVASASTHNITQVTTVEDNCLVLYGLSFDGGDGYTFSVSGTGWQEVDESTNSDGNRSYNSGCWGYRDLASHGASGAAAVLCGSSDGAAYFQIAFNVATSDGVSDTVTPAEVETRVELYGTPTTIPGMGLEQTAQREAQITINDPTVTSVGGGNAVDGLKLGDIVTVLESVQVNVTEGVLFGDIIAGTVIAGSTTYTADVVNDTKLGEILTPRATYYTDLLEGLKLGDTITTGNVISTEIAEGAKFGELASTIQTILGRIVDGLKAGDLASLNATFEPEVTDGLKLGDITDGTVSGEISGVITDGVRFGEDFRVNFTLSVDTLEAEITLYGTPSTQVGTTLEQTAQQEIQVTIHAPAIDIAHGGINLEGLKLGEILTGEGTLFASLADGLKLGDVIAGTVTAPGVIAGDIVDGLKLGETSQIVATLAAVLTEGLKLGDLISSGGGISVSIADGARFGETVITTLTLAAESVEEVKFGETVKAEKTQFPQITDGAKLGDLITGEVAGLLEGDIVDGAKLGDLTTVAQTGLYEGDIVDGIRLGAEGIGTPGGEIADIAVIDGEDAGTTPWELDSLTEDAGNTFTLSAAAALHGSGGYKMDIAPGPGGPQCFGERTFTGTNDIYERFYFYIPSWNQTDGQNTRYALIRDGTTRLVTFYLYWHSASSTFGVYCIIQHGGGSAAIYNNIAGSDISLNTPYYIDVRYKGGDAATGGGEIWLNGASKGSNFTLNTSAYQPDRAQLGTYYYSGVTCPTGTIYFDDLLLSTTGPIGAYSGAEGAIFPHAQLIAYPKLIEGFKSGDLIVTTTKYITATIDGIKLGETASTLLQHVIRVVEGIKLGDITSGKGTYYSGIIDGALFGDILSYEAGLDGIITEGIKLGDVTAKNLVLLANIADEVKIGEAGQAIFRFFVTTNEGVKLGENIASVLNLIASCTEGARFGDIETAAFYDTYEGNIIDGLKVGENVSVHYGGAVGMVTVSFSSRAAVITFTTY
jgi:hypothetical protein